ncbi:MAG: 3-deoxy-D-manno-octulosonate 8-phosphate phosphatase, partial [Planctomycetes bacterium HGW-Planctomycetes-1]
MSITEKAKQIKMLILDVDGVLTDGGIIINAEGKEIKVFNVYDGAGIELA